MVRMQLGQRVEIRQRPLPDEVVDARARFGELAEKLGPEIEPRIQRRHELHRSILDVMCEAHADFVDRTDFDPEADTRQGAAWMMAGRCLSLAGTLLGLLEQGYGPEIVPTARSLHEASRLLAVLLDSSETELADRWLAGEWVRPKAMSQAEERGQTRMAEEMIRAGIAPPGRTHELTKDVYSALSNVAHHSRAGFSGDFNRTVRRFQYGPHASPLRRAAWQQQADEILYDAVLSVGLLLTKCFGPGFWTEQVEPALDAIRTARAREPLLPDELVQEASTL